MVKKLINRFDTRFLRGRLRRLMGVFGGVRDREERAYAEAAARSGGELGEDVKGFWGAPVAKRFLGELQGFSESGRCAVVVTDACSRTGAPLIALKIAEELASAHGYSVITVSLHDEGGEIAPDFRKLGPFLCIEDALKGRPGSIDEACGSVMSVIGTKSPSVVFLNSVVTRFLLRYPIPGAVTLTLVHEVGYFYPKGQLNDLGMSDYVVFPSRYVERHVHENHNVPEKKCRLLPQGLMREELLEIGDREEKRAKVRKQLKIGEGAKIVIGVGTRHFRKGFDRFISIAQVAFEMPGGEDVHFVWLGGRHENDGEISFWADHEVEFGRSMGRVHLVDAVKSPEIWYAAADLFLLSSRADPFPCVAQEAFAAGLPVLCYEGATGSEEMMSPEIFRELVEPSGSGAEMAKRVIRLFADKDVYGSIRDEMRKVIRDDYRFSEYVEGLLELGGLEGVRNGTSSSGEKVVENNE